MDDIERAAAFKIIDTFKNAPELKLDSSRYEIDHEFESIEDELNIDIQKRKNPAST